MHWKDWSWSWNSNTLAIWCEELNDLKTLMLGKIEGEGDDRGWDGCMASLTWWTWVWVSSGSWWWTGKPGVLPSIGLQSDKTEQLNWTGGTKNLLAGLREKRQKTCTELAKKVCSGSGFFQYHLMKKPEFSGQPNK